MFDNFEEIMFFIFIFIIVLFFYLHIQFQFKTSNDLEIYEIENEVSKEKLEEIFDLRQPVALNVTEELSQLIPLFEKNNISKEFPSYEIKIRNKKNIGTSEDMFIPIQHNIADKLFLKDSTQNFYSENNSDFLLETGLAKHIKINDFILKPHLSCNSKYDFLEHRSEVNVWNPQENYKFAMQKIKCLDVVLPVGKILYIPPYWSYSIKLQKNSSLLTMKYQTYMNICALSPKLIINLLQTHNIKSTYLKKMELKNIAEPTIVEPTIIESEKKEIQPIDFPEISETKIDEIPMN